MKALRPQSVSKIRASVTCLILLAGLSLAAWPVAHALGSATSRQSVLTPQERRGKQIYLRGASDSGREIFAYIGDESVEVPGSTMACASCHGLNGEGKPEGGVVPSNLVWEALTKPYGVSHTGGRTHPPYTERALELAITRGLDPAGHRLSNVMPRYQMSREDMDALVAYLKRLGKDLDPGVSDGRIVIGTVLPARSDLAGVGQAVRAVTTAYFEEVNSRNGIYNRKLELKFVETADTPAATAEKVRRFIQDEQVFAMTSAFTAGADKELASLMDELGVPLVGPITLYPQVGHPLNRNVFYLVSGMDGLGRALVNFASQNSSAEKPGAAVVYPEGGLSGSVAEAIKDQCQKKGCGVPQPYVYQNGRFDAAACAKELSRAGRSVVFFLGTGEAALALMKEADRLRWSPLLYLPGAAVGEGVFDAPLSFNRKVFISFPTSPADQSAEGVEEFRALAAKYRLPATHVSAQVSAYSAAKVLSEGLKRAGRELSREKLVEALEGLNEYSTGLSPAITYGPNRRVGASGAYVITVDLESRKFLPVSPWVDTN